MDMDISMDIHAKSVDMDMDMDGKFHIHGNPVWCTTSRRQHQLPITPLLIDGAAVDPAKSVRDLGIYVDADLVMRTHTQRIVSRCFAALRQLRQKRR